MDLSLTATVRSMLHCINSNQWKLPQWDEQIGGQHDSNTTCTSLNPEFDDTDKKRKDVRMSEQHSRMPITYNTPEFVHSPASKLIFLHM